MSKGIIQAVIDILFILVLMVQCYNLGKIVQLRQIMEYQYKVVEEKVGDIELWK